MHRLHRSRGQRSGRAWLLELGCLRRAERADPYWAGLHGRLHLHDPWKNHSAHGWRLTLPGQAAVDHQDICGRRRSLTVDAVLRYDYIQGPS